MTPETRETLQRAHTWLAEDPATRWTTGYFGVSWRQAPQQNELAGCTSWSELARVARSGELVACCAAGLIGLASLNRAGNLDYQQIDEALAALADCVAGPLTRSPSDAINTVTDWNDAARRTVRQVLDALQRAIDAP